MSDQDAVRGKLQQLAGRFIKRTAEELVTLKGLIESARSGDADSLAQLRHLAHRMHGTGATLGFTDIGEQAGIIERLTDGRPCDFDGLATSAARIEELLRAAAAKNGVSL